MSPLSLCIIGMRKNGIGDMLGVNVVIMNLVESPASKTGSINHQ